MRAVIEADQIPTMRDVLAWLEQCTDVEMGDGDTARLLARYLLEAELDEWDKHDLRKLLPMIAAHTAGQRGDE